MNHRIWCAALCLACSVTQAKVQCPSLWDRDGSPSTYYALVFLDLAANQKRDQLVSQVTPLLTDVARRLSERSGSKKRLKIELVVCQHRVGSTDFAVEELRRFLDAKVVAVFWKDQEGDKQGLVQLAVPVFLRNITAARRDVEVVTLYDAKSRDPVDSWIEVFAQDAAFYKPFVAMGLATVYQDESDYKQAWMALCDSRVGLALLARSTLRPQRDALEREIVAQLVVLMKDLEMAARKPGSSTLPPCAVPAQ